MLQLKQAEIADAPAISLLHAASWRFAYRGLLPQDYLDAISDTRWVEPFTKLLSGDGMRALLAYEGDAPAGCVSYGEPVGMEGAPPPGWGYVLTLYVHPDHTKKGYGTALLQAAENGLRQQGYTYVFLYVLDTNVSARRFYERSGYVWDGTGINCPIGSVTVRDLRYVKEL
ncbi:MAG: GNAT family N-acetyltransferase [Bacillota bacterium]